MAKKKGTSSLHSAVAGSPSAVSSISDNGITPAPITPLLKEEAGKDNSPESPQVTTVLPETMEVEPSKPQYLSSWDKGFFPSLNSDAGKQIPIVQAIADYNKWASDTGNKPLDLISTYATLQGRDPNKSIADNEEDDRRQRSNERWERIGNVLSHLGNFVGTTAYGAPSQQLETGQQLSARQKQLRDATIALRDKRGATLMDAYLKDLTMKQAAEKDANAQYLAAQKLKLEEQKNLLSTRLAMAKDERERVKLVADLQKVAADIERINTLTPYDVKVKQSTIARNYSRGSGSSGRSNEYKKQLDKDFARLAEEYPEDFQRYEKKHGIYAASSNGYGGNNGGGKRWDDNLKRQFVAEMERKKKAAAGDQGGEDVTDLYKTEK